ncbi:hypothetical protein ABKN59_010622 [Abortiporus biennis]
MHNVEKLSEVRQLYRHIVVHNPTCAFNIKAAGTRALEHRKLPWLLEKLFGTGTFVKEAGLPRYHLHSGEPRNTNHVYLYPRVILDYRILHCTFGEGKTPDSEIAPPGRFGAVSYLFHFPGVRFKQTSKFQKANLGDSRINLCVVRLDAAVRREIDLQSLCQLTGGNRIQWRDDTDPSSFLTDCASKSPPPFASSFCRMPNSA